MVITLQEQTKKNHPRRIRRSLLASLLFLLALVIWTPAFTTSPYQLEVEFFEVIEIPDDIEIPPPKEIPSPKPVHNFFIDPNAPEDQTIDDTEIPLDELIPPTIPDRQPETQPFVAYDSPPEATYKVRPRYSELAREAEMTGWVELVVIVDEKGNVSGVSVLRSTAPAPLEKAAMQATRKWRFKPARQRNQSVAAKITLEFSFRLY